MYTLPDIAVMLIATDGEDRADLIGVGIGKYLTPEFCTRMLALPVVS
jgi:hypothetical protein